MSPDCKKKWTNNNKSIEGQSLGRKRKKSEAEQKLSPQKRSMENIPFRHSPARGTGVGL